MSTQRWVLVDTVTDETWTMPINPDSMTSPFGPKSFRHAAGIRLGLDRIRTFISPAEAVRWEWGGVIRTKEHHDQLEAWARKDVLVDITDHLDRTWRVLITSFEPTDRRPTNRTPWRLRYSMKSLIVEAVA